jgi:hypothetical protein
MVSLAAPCIEPALGLYINKGNQSLPLYYANKAISCYEAAIIMNDKLAGIYHPNAAFLYSLKGLMYFYKGDYKKALENYDLGIKRLTLYPYVFTTNNAILFDLLKWKAWCFDDMYNQNKDLRLLYKIEKIMLLEEKYWLQYAKPIFRNKERYNTNGYISSPYNDLAKNYFKLYKATGEKQYLDLYFEYDEKSKYTGLLENLCKERKVQLRNSSDTFVFKTYESFENLLLKNNNKIQANEDAKAIFEKYYKTYNFKQEQTD